VHDAQLITLKHCIKGTDHDGQNEQLIWITNFENKSDLRLFALRYKVLSSSPHS